MTCIVGLVENGIVYLGADSAGSAGNVLAVRRDEKVFRNGEFVMGFTDSFRMGQLLRYAFTPPKIPEGRDLMAYMVTDFVDAVRACFGDGGYRREENSVETGGVFLVGVRGRLFEIESDFQVGERVRPYAAIGSGMDVALGSLFTSSGDPGRRLQAALLAADEFTTTVCGPFVFSSTEEECCDVPA
jgi:ATP-dependent protease HslVU (ClpYQ) peptidase subunit